MLPVSCCCRRILYAEHLEYVPKSAWGGRGFSLVLLLARPGLLLNPAIQNASTSLACNLHFAPSHCMHLFSSQNSSSHLLKCPKPRGLPSEKQSILRSKAIIWKALHIADRFTINFPQHKPLVAHASSSVPRACAESWPYPSLPKQHPDFVQ
jgi:hypothetical protein